MADMEMELCELDKELAEVLTAISIISKRLARKITAKYMTKEEKENEDEDEGTVNAHR